VHKQIAHVTPFTLQLLTLTSGLACLKNISSTNVLLTGCDIHVDDQQNCIVLGGLPGSNHRALDCIQCKA